MDVSKFIKRKHIVVVPSTEEGGEDFWVEISNQKLNLANRKRLDAAVEIQDWAELFEVFELLDLSWNLSQNGRPVEITREIFTDADSPVVEDVWYAINRALNESYSVSEGELTPVSTTASMEAALTAKPVGHQIGTSSASLQES